MQCLAAALSNAELAEAFSNDGIGVGVGVGGVAWRGVRGSQRSKQPASPGVAGHWPVALNRYGESGNC